MKTLTQLKHTGLLVYWIEHLVSSSYSSAKDTTVNDLQVSRPLILQTPAARTVARATMFVRSTPTGTKPRNAHRTQAYLSANYATEMSFVQSPMVAMTACVTVLKLPRLRLRVAS